MRRFGLIILAATCFASVANADFLLVPDSSNDVLMLFDRSDGSLVNPSFIDMSAQGGTPVNAVHVASRNEIWVSNQINDTIHRYSTAGAYLGDVAGAMDNVRGFEVVGDTAYLTNSGSNDGAPGDAVIMIDVPTASATGFFTAGDPFDALYRQDPNGRDELLVNDIAADNIDRYTLAGNFIANFHDSDGASGVDFPEQMTLTSRNTVLVGGFSSPGGIYEYDANGNQINYWDVGGIRGAFELDNGNIMFTDSGGVHIFDPAKNNVMTVVDGVSGRFIEATTVPEPMTLGLLAAGGLAVFRRRR